MKFQIVEDAEQDRNFRQEAIDVWHKILAAPKTKWEHYQDAKVLELGKIDKKYSDLALQVVEAEDEEQEETGAFGWDLDHPDDNGIEIFLKKSDIPKTLALFKRRKNLETTFIHEFVHYLDRKRYKDQESYKNIRVSYNTATSNYEEYFNGPLEFNAYSQQFMKEIEDMLNLERKGYEKRGHGENFAKDVLENVLSSFDRFWKSFPYQFAPDFLFFFKHLSPKNKKKIQRRMYGFYSKLRTDLEKEVK